MYLRWPGEREKGGCPKGALPPEKLWYPGAFSACQAQSRGGSVGATNPCKRLHLTIASDPGVIHGAGVVSAEGEEVMNRTFASAAPASALVLLESWSRGKLTLNEEEFNELWDKVTDALERINNSKYRFSGQEKAAEPEVEDDGLSEF